ncbi:TPA: hypothetical protein N0F65_012388, partial [Lagenidium giganteum]
LHKIERAAQLRARDLLRRTGEQATAPTQLNSIQPDTTRRRATSNVTAVQMGGSGKVPPVQHMYFLEGGLLVVNNLLKTDQWVHDDERTHCNVCVQQFLPFRRRHHCRTCGEVVCGGCSSHRKIHLTDVNVECATRVCTFCMIRATDASINANECAVRETISMNQKTPVLPQRRKHMSMMSMDSELTDGSVKKSARLEIVRNSTIMTTESDPTLNLLVAMVARTLECPVAFVGILDDKNLLLKASVGWDKTHIPRDECVCSLTMLQERTIIASDTNQDKHFVATNLAINGALIRADCGAAIGMLGQCIGTICAIDVVLHPDTTSSIKSTLEAVANITSEVLEQRVDGTAKVSDARSASESGSDSTLADPNPLYRNFNALDCLSDNSSSTTTISNYNQSNYIVSPRESSIAMMLPSVPSEYSEKICTSINAFQYLLSSAWNERTGDGDVKGFECIKAGRLFTKSCLNVHGDCSTVINQILNYEDARVYQRICSRVTRRYQLNHQTWMDEICFQEVMTGADAFEVRVLSHWRQYPDGSNIIIATNGARLYEADERDLLFGWFIAPLSHDGNTVSVSCILAQPIENQTQEVNLSVDLMVRLQSVLPAVIARPRMSSDASNPSSTDTSGSDNQRSHEANSSILEITSSVSDSGIPSDSSSLACSYRLLAVRTAHHEVSQVSHLNQNERMMLDLLDKTISTQEVLAAQQHMMANVMGYHGTQLQRISSAIQRVETMLADNGKKLKRAPAPTTDVPLHLRHSLS